METNQEEALSAKTTDQVPVEAEETLNANGKRELLGSDDETMKVAEDETPGKPKLTPAERKQLKMERFKKLKAAKAKVKTVRQVVFKDENVAAQVLNEANPGLEYVFDYDALRKKFACTVEVKVASPGLVDQVHRFVGEAGSKKVT
jgi:hypothetical protein